MWDIIKNALTTLWDLLGPIQPYIPWVIGITATILLAVRYGGAWIIRKTEQVRTRTHKEHFHAKSALLALGAITELYAPAKLYTIQVSTDEEAQDDKKPLKLAWLSPYPRAVKASYKRNRVPKTEKLEARRQIAEASRHVKVEAWNEDETNPQDHYLITLELDGHDPEEFRRMEGKIKGQLGLHSLEEHQDKNAYTISFIAHTTEPKDKLREQKLGMDFFTSHPARTPYKLPLAIREDGKPWSLPTHHTLIYGMTGSGKGSPIHGTIMQLSPYVQNGTCKLYGIDPKSSELRPYQETSLFQEVVDETDEAQTLIYQLHTLMKTRAKQKTVNLQTAELGRSLEASKQNPMIVLIIDEMLSLLIALKQLGKTGAATTTLLTEVLAQGRSLGIYVIGATQAVDTELLGRMRVNFANTIILRQESAYFNDMFLGDGAGKAGYDSTAIPLSTKANGYAYAGIGYVKEEGGNPVKVRFAYSSDQDIANLCLAFPKHQIGRMGSNTSKTVQTQKDEYELPTLDDFDF